MTSHEMLPCFSKPHADSRQQEILFPGWGGDDGFRLMISEIADSSPTLYYWRDCRWNCRMSRGHGWAVLSVRRAISYVCCRDSYFILVMMVAWYDYQLYSYKLLSPRRWAGIFIFDHRRLANAWLTSAWSIISVMKPACSARNCRRFHNY